jgi:hypothetical protein
MPELPKRIHLRGEGYQEEARAGEALLPGHLINVASTGKVVKHAVYGGVAEKAFALEDALQGREIGDAFAEDELVPFIIAQPGDVIYAFLAAGEVTTLDDYLTSDGNGALAVAAGTNVVIAKALEAVGSEASSASADVRIKVRIL